MIDKRVKKILVADDDLAICEAVQFMLEEEGYRVETMLRGERLYKLDKELPDLLLLDIWLSGQDGREICKYLKKKAATQHIPIIMISASRDMAESVNHAGADDFLAKPFKIDDLLDKIAAFTSQRVD